MRSPTTWALALVLLGSSAAVADDTVFSGPQVGEKLTPFRVKGVYDDQAGREFDLISQAGDKPVFLIFVHEVTRPSIALTRVLMTYAAQHGDKGLVSGVVWLADDVTAAEQFLLRARHAMPSEVPIGISVDGAEGPGAYGLNRHVALTVLVGRGGIVSGNFALIQPSVQADAPKILAKVAEAIDEAPPSPRELLALSQPAPGMPASRPEETDPKLAELLRAVIRKDATADQVERAAEALEAHVAKDEMARAQVGRITRRILDSGRLPNYGTPAARQYLRKWAERFGSTDRGDGESKAPDATESKEEVRDSSNRNDR